jgi:hypothetical protein
MKGKGRGKEEKIGKGNVHFFSYSGLSVVLGE